MDIYPHIGGDKNDTTITEGLRYNYRGIKVTGVIGKKHQSSEHLT